MKVVLFCGGLGMRLRDYSKDVPKPMVPIGYRPVLWHVMKYYAHFGHKEFILCLGYKADVIKDYFLRYNEAVSNDFVLTEGNRLEMLATDIQDWRITFVDTGFASNIGERLRRIREHVQEDEMFLANYSDSVTNFDLPQLIARMQDSDKVAGFAAVKPSQTVHLVDFGDGDEVNDIRDLHGTDLWINGGYFVLRQEIFEYLHEDEELVIEPFQRLMRDKKLVAQRHDGFWKAMETSKDKYELDLLYEGGDAPWELWKR